MLCSTLHWISTLGGERLLSAWKGRYDIEWKVSIPLYWLLVGRAVALPVIARPSCTKLQGEVAPERWFKRFIGEWIGWHLTQELRESLSLFRHIVARNSPEAAAAVMRLCQIVPLILTGTHDDELLRKIGSLHASSHTSNQNWLTMNFSTSMALVWVFWQAFLFRYNLYVSQEALRRWSCPCEEEIEFRSRAFRGCLLVWESMKKSFQLCCSTSSPFVKFELSIDFWFHLPQRKLRGYCLLCFLLDSLQGPVSSFRPILNKSYYV